MKYLFVTLDNITQIVSSLSHFGIFKAHLKMQFFVFQNIFYHPFHHENAFDDNSAVVTCLNTDACLTADPGVASSISTWSHTFVEIDHEIISTVIFIPSTDSFKKGCCQLQVKVCTQSTG